MTCVEVLSTLFVDVHRVSANVLVVVRAVIVAVVVVVVIRVVIAITPVVATVIVAAVPGRVSVVRPAVIHNRGAVPAAVPTAIPPTATAMTHHRSDGDPRAESNNACGRDVSRSVRRSYISRDYIRRPVNNCRVVLRNVDNLRIGRLNDYDLRRLLHHRDLRAGLEITFCFGLRAQSLDCSHYVGLLIVIGLSQ